MINPIHILILALMPFSYNSSTIQNESKNSDETSAIEKAYDKNKAKSLFNGKDLTGWNRKVVCRRRAYNMRKRT